MTDPSDQEIQEFAHDFPQAFGILQQELRGRAARDFVADRLAGGHGRRLQLLAHLAVEDVTNNPSSEDPRHVLIAEPDSVAIRLAGAIRQFTHRFGPLT